MKRLWVDLRVWDKDMATTAIESGADAIVVNQAADVRRLGRISTIAPDGDLIPGTDVQFVVITDKESEQDALNKAKTGWVVVSTTDWTVIPLENLVSQSDRIIAEVHTAAEAETALTVLEKGVAGVLLVPDRPAEIRAVAGLVKGAGGKVSLEPFTVTAIRQTGMGDRVCVDTCSLLRDGEGMLVGNSSSSFFLVHAETLENPYVAPRPFRVNAGAVHAYALMENGKTAYLSEIEAGDRVLISDAGGSTKGATVGRIKIEQRPLLLVEAHAESGNATASLVLQNAETIRLVTEKGEARSVVELQVGDRVLGHVTKGGRHFGVAIDETIVEK
jgi:3-dehydroquinate synthase II